jgi:hypothetical protein
MVPLARAGDGKLEEAAAAGMPAAADGRGLLVERRVAADPRILGVAAELLGLRGAVVGGTELVGDAARIGGGVTG